MLHQQFFFCRCFFMRENKTHTSTRSRSFHLSWMENRKKFNSKFKWQALMKKKKGFPIEMPEDWRRKIKFFHLFHISQQLFWIFERKNLVVNYNFLRKSPNRITSLKPINFPVDPFCLDEFSLVFPHFLRYTPLWKEGGKLKGVTFFCVKLWEMKITSQGK